MTEIEPLEAAQKIIEEQIDDAIVVVREDMKIVYANKAAEVLFKYDRDELVGNDVKMLVPTPRQDAHEAQALEWWKKPAEVSVHERRGLTAVDSEGREFPVVIKLVPFGGGDRLVTAIVREVFAERPENKWDRLIRGVSFSHLALALTLIALVFSLIVTGTDIKTAFRITNSLVVAVGAGLLISYAPSVWEAVRSRNLSPGHLLVFGITFNWVGIVIRSVSWYVTGQTPPVGDLAPWLGALFLAVLGGFLHVAAVEAIESRWPPRHFILASLTAAAVTAYTMIRFL